MNRTTDSQIYDKIDHAKKLLYPLTSITIRPAGFPPMEMSKKHFGLAMVQAVLANGRKGKISLALWTGRSK